MKIGNEEFGRVAILVLDYDPRRETRPSVAVIDMYEKLNQHLRLKYGGSSDLGNDVTVLANEELVAKHQKDFEDNGLSFFPDWRNSKEYRELLREGLRQGQDIYVMKDVGNRGGFGAWFLPQYELRKVTKESLNILNPEGKIDLLPK